jgi:hypothetical protein
MYYFIFYLNPCKNTINQTKIALSNFDDKRFIINDGYSTLAHGYYHIEESEKSI